MVTACIRLIEALAQAGVTPEQADELVATIEAGAVAAAHTVVSEDSPSHTQEEAI
ncbi:hypothetical protein ACFVJK_38870 [Streptomyces sp. NPDC127172]|uniref:hypothetical protein n=1 Tax=Streptomyces sp. NPDC127172 TaxID=3345382 RepID=UPI00363B3C6C